MGKIKQKRITYSHLEHWLEGETSIWILLDSKLRAGEWMEAAVKNCCHIYQALRRELKFTPLDDVSFGRWAEYWSMLERQKALTPLLKWAFAALYSLIMEQPVPDRPLGHLKVSSVYSLFPGRLGRFLRSVSRTLSHDMRTEAVGNSRYRKAFSRAEFILNLKKGCANIDASFLDEGLNKAWDTLTTAQPVDRSDPECIMIEKAITRIVREVFSVEKKDGSRRPIIYHSSPELPFPSSSGHASARGVDGGAASVILEAWKEASVESLDSDMGALTASLSSYGNYQNEPRSVRRHDIFAEKIRLLFEKEQRSFTARPMAIAEPLKVRVVTLGPEVSYWLLRDLQKFLWRVISKHPTFELIGSPATADKFSDFICADDEVHVSGDYKDATNQLKSHFSEFAATEIGKQCKLPPELLDLFIKALTRHELKRIHPDWNLALARWLDSEPVLGCDTALPETGSKGLFVKNGQVTELYTSWKKSTPKKPFKGASQIHESIRQILSEKGFGSVILDEYWGCGERCPKTLDAVWQLAPQKNGQLMGSPVSFGILCIVNAAICRVAIENDHRNLRAHLHPMDVKSTGDWNDLLEQEDSLADEEDIERKNLRQRVKKLSQFRLKINGDDCVFPTTRKGIENWRMLGTYVGLSESVGKTYFSKDWFQINSQGFVITENREIISVPYLNLGHLSPTDPKGGEYRNWSMLSSLGREWLKGIRDPAKNRDRYVRWFLTAHAGLISRIPKKVSYWLPYHLGGAGLPFVGTLDPTAVSFRQRELACYLQKTRKTVTHSCRGFSSPKWFEEGMRELAKFRKVVPEREIREFPWLHQEGSSTSPLWGYACRQSESKIGMKKLRGNFEAMWKKSKGSGAGDLGLYLQEKDFSLQLAYGSDELLDDRFDRPLRVMDSVLGIPLTRQISPTVPHQVKGRKYGILVELGCAIHLLKKQETASSPLGV